ncbi:hypothetical protein GGS21DRAFT_506038 [Xylaria nigripes]|nr:hypothetical protein GGS21DRAFT_506038 [Xylaria nigripes]
MQIKFPAILASTAALVSARCVLVGLYENDCEWCGVAPYCGRDERPIGTTDGPYTLIFTTENNDHYELLGGGANSRHGASPTPISAALSDTSGSGAAVGFFISRLTLFCSYPHVVPVLLVIAGAYRIS